MRTSSELSQISFSVAVLAGGSSRRMGQDKALIEIDGSAMVLRVLAEAKLASPTESFVVGRAGETWPGVRSVPDRFPGEGPLGGLITALSHSVADMVVLMPCDLLHPAAALVRSVVEALVADPDLDVVVPMVENRWQYVQAGFRREVLAHLEEQFDAGARSVHACLSGLSVAELAFHQTQWFADADEPADLPVASQQYNLGE